MTRRIPFAYRLGVAVSTPIVRWWGRLTVQGVLPPTGPTLVIANHDSHWDPLVIAVAARHRQIRALAKASLWRNRALARILDSAGQIPIERGRADIQALQAAIDALRCGDCVGVFPEGTISRGMPLRARSGAGRLALAVPEARIVCVRVIGSVDIVRFPKRPRLRVEFFEPPSGQPVPGESAMAVVKRVVADIRASAPYAVPGRRRKAEQLRRLAAARQAAESDV